MKELSEIPKGENADILRIDVAEFATSYPTIVNFVNSSKLEGWGFKESIAILTIATDPANRNFIEKGFLALQRINDAADLENKLKLLKKYSAQIQQFVDNEIIAPQNVQYLIEIPLKDFELLVHRMEKNAKYVKLNILNDVLLLDDNKYESLIADLDSLTENALNTLSKAINSSSIRLTRFFPFDNNASVDEEWKILLEALFYPAVQSIFPAQIHYYRLINLFKEENWRLHFLTALSDPFILEKIKDKSDEFFHDNYSVCAGLIEAKIVEVGELLNNPSLLPLYQLGYLSSDELMDRQYWESDALILLAKYKLLLALEEVVTNPKWQALGRFWLNPPSGIADLCAVLSPLNSIRTFSDNHDHVALTSATECSLYEAMHALLNAESVIESCFAGALKILAAKQLPYSGYGRREKIIMQTYKEEDEKLQQFNTVMKITNRFELAALLEELGDTQKAYALYLQIPKSDPNYGNALWHAGNIALNSGSYAEAKYLFAKAKVIAINKQDSDFVRHCDVLLACADKKVKGEIYALSDLNNNNYENSNSNSTLN